MASGGGSRFRVINSSLYFLPGNVEFIVPNPPPPTHFCRLDKNVSPRIYPIDTFGIHYIRKHTAPDKEDTGPSSFKIFTGPKMRLRPFKNYPLYLYCIVMYFNILRAIKTFQISFCLLIVLNTHPRLCTHIFFYLIYQPVINSTSTYG